MLGWREVATTAQGSAKSKIMAHAMEANVTRQKHVFVNLTTGERHGEHCDRRRDVK